MPDSEADEPKDLNNASETDEHHEKAYEHRVVA
jgi:hypothetical protein